MSKDTFLVLKLFWKCLSFASYVLVIKVLLIV
nr:hypothetical protein CoNPh37_CDS0079 [Staphylococcus phage S-CoN_Ph37]